MPEQTATEGKYAGKTAEQIVAIMNARGLDQDGVNAIYALRGLGTAPTLNANQIGVRRGTGRAGQVIYGADGKPITSGQARADANDILNNFNTTAVDPFRVRSGISNAAGGILNAVGSYVGGPVWQAFTGLADAGNSALGNNDGTSYTDGRRSTTDRAGAAIGSIAGMAGGPGSYGNASSGAPTGDDLGAFSNGGKGGMAGVGSSDPNGIGGILGGGSVANGSGSGSWTDWLEPLIEVGGALYAGNQAGNAANDQIKGVREALAEQRRQYDQNRADLAPYREAGGVGINEILRGLGYGDKTGNGEVGQFNQTFDASHMYDDPGYQFRLDEGSKALQGANAATRGVQNGRTLRELTRYGQDYASGEYNNAYNRFNNDQSTRYNRLASLAGLGQTATNTGIQSGSNSANNISDLTVDSANAAAAGRVAQTNAYGQGLESLANFYRNRRYGGADTNWLGG